MIHKTFQQPLTLATTLLLCLPLTMCKPKDEAGKSDSTATTVQASPLQLLAEKTIKEDPNVELVEVLGDKIHLRNVYTQIGMELTFQEIIDGKYEKIQGGEGEAGNVLKAHSPEKLNEGKAPNTADWGKSPAWVPRYPGLKIQGNPMHAPKQDGSMWGYLSTSHKDSIKKISDYYVEKFKASGLVLSADMRKETSAVLVFRNQMPDQAQDGEKQSATISLNRQGTLTTVIIQYAYGMDSF